MKIIFLLLFCSSSCFGIIELISFKAEDCYGNGPAIEKFFRAHRIKHAVDVGAFLEGAETVAGLPIDLVYLEESRDFDSVLADLNAWYPHVKGHGVLCGNAFCSSPAVACAVQLFALQNHLIVEQGETREFWALKELQSLPITFSGSLEPYSNLSHILPFDPHGWYFNKNQIEQLFKTRTIRNVVEIGSWLGCSTRHFASLIPPGGKVYAVDHWNGSAEHQPGQPHWCKQIAYLYEQFLSNVILSNLTDRIIPIKKESTEASSLFSDISVDLVYLDGSHDVQSVFADLTVWYPHIQGHGILCGSTWGYHEVRNAVQQFAQEHRLSIKASGDFWELKDFYTPQPISFSIPDIKVVKEVPYKDKAFASLIPGLNSTYTYDIEADYYADYQRSYFAVTSKKAGWDCMRHYEILANGCIPYFVDIESCLPEDLSFLPKELIKEAMHLEGVSFLGVNYLFNKDRYFALLHQLLEYTRNHLTCRAVASNFLERMKYSGNGPILLLSGNKIPDYLKDTLLIGLKQLHPQKVFDVPRIDFIYIDYPEEEALHSHGKGFSYTRIVEEQAIDREKIEERIKAKEFELIIFGNVHRGLPYKELVETMYEQEKVAYLCGEDCHVCDYVGWPNLFLREFSGNIEYTRSTSKAPKWD